MLVKLIKHEFYATWKVMLIFETVLLCLGVAGFLLMGALVGTVTGSNRPNNDSVISMLVTSSITWFVVYALSLFAVSIGTLVFLTVRYYRNLYANEGFLTFTLPVETRDILHAKMIVGYIWQISTFLLIGFSIFLTLSGVYWNLPMSARNEVTKELFDIFRDFREFPLPLFILHCLIIPLHSLMTIYFCISVGQLWYKHKIGGAVICYFALRFINKIIGSGVSIHNMITAINFEGNMSINRIFTRSFGFSLIYECVWLIAFYITIRYVNDHQINLG
ncbi:MAG: hypothetical protein K6C95_01300 [Lachnospiraceae bacterium]|nr:hypothetical protein [Lachnospiraceae bacterium]